MISFHIIIIWAMRHVNFRVMGAALGKLFVGWIIFLILIVVSQHQQSEYFRLLYMLRKINAKSINKSTTRSEIFFAPIPEKLHLSTKFISASFTLKNVITQEEEIVLALWRELLCYICILHNNDKKEMLMIYTFDSLTVSLFRLDIWHLKGK